MRVSRKGGYDEDFCSCCAGGTRVNSGPRTGSGVVQGVLPSFPRRCRNARSSPWNGLRPEAMVGGRGKEKISGPLLGRLGDVRGQTAVLGDLVEVKIRWSSVCACQRSVRPNRKRSASNCTYHAQHSDLSTAMGQGVGNDRGCYLRWKHYAATGLLRSR